MTLGEISSYASSKAKQKEKMETLENQIKWRGMIQQRRDLLLLRTQYNNLSPDKAAKSLMRLKQSYYDQGGKAGKHLAWRTQKKF